MPKDLFSEQAADYAKWRPGYPTELIKYIISFVPHRNTAWDCATGNGQAAILLAEHMDHVFATDLSTEQLKYAKQHPKITYSQSPAEHTQFGANTFDLVTVAQAYHWFDRQAFCTEATRVCKPGAVVAVWGYGLCYASEPLITELVRRFYEDVTGPYWDAARKYIEEEYKTVYFGFNEIPVNQQFSIKMQWALRDLEGYLNSWSAVQKYIKVNGHNPVESFIDEVSNHWPSKEKLQFEFPLYLRLGQVHK
jgi:ubiquinone/menaquinone biosynthesis C-methylase UbiE